MWMCICVSVCKHCLNSNSNKFSFIFHQRPPKYVNCKCIDQQANSNESKINNNNKRGRGAKSTSQVSVFQYLYVYVNWLLIYFHANGKSTKKKKNERKKWNRINCMLNVPNVQMEMTALNVAFTIFPKSKHSHLFVFFFSFPCAWASKCLSTYL